MNELIKLFLSFFYLPKEASKMEYNVGVIGRNFPVEGRKFIRVFDGKRHIYLEVKNQKFFDITYYDGHLKYDE